VVGVGEGGVEVVEGIHGGGRRRWWWGGNGFGRGREGGQVRGCGGRDASQEGWLWLREKEEICWVSTRKRLAFILLSSRDLDPLRRAALLPAPGTGGTPQPPDLIADVMAGSHTTIPSTAPLLANTHVCVGFKFHLCVVGSKDMY
jgi:hypothetical protein